MADNIPDYGSTGDQIHDESVEQNKIYYQTGNGLLYSKGISLEIEQNVQQSKFERFYRSVFIAVERRPDDQNVEKGELFFLVEQIYSWILLEGDTNDFTQIGRFLKQLYSLAPDVFQVCTTIITNPSSELSPSLVNYVQQLGKEFQPVSEMNMPIHSYLEKELMDHHVAEDVSDEMREDLAELQAAVNTGNVRPVRKLLDELLSHLPGMKQPIRHWLVESNEVPPTIKVFARKYLT